MNRWVPWAAAAGHNHAERVLAADAHQATQHLDHRSFDVVVTDIAMAGITGPDLLEHVQHRGLTTTAPPTSASQG